MEIKIKKSNDKSKYIINREEENDDVIRYQQTRDEGIFEKIYKKRISTLNHLSRKYANLYDSQDDMYGFLNVIFVSCVNGYKKERIKIVNGKEKRLKTQFNTYFYTSVLNRVVNIITSKNAQKRTPLEQIDDCGNSISNHLLSLDYEYSNKSSTDGADLKDVVTEDSNSFKSEDNMFANDVISVLSGSHSKEEKDVMRNFLTKISEGYSVSGILRDLKTVSSHICVDDKDTDIIESVGVLDFLKAKLNKKFKIEDYSLKEGVLKYTIVLNSTPETEIILRNIKKIKSKRNLYLDIIGVSN